jgi:hypothetical protein
MHIISLTSVIHNYFRLSNFRSRAYKEYSLHTGLMDLATIKRLLLSERPSDDYIVGVQGFHQFAYRGKKLDVKIRCPCVKCVNMLLQKQPIVYDHLVCHGMLRGYTIWGCHRETASYISANKDSESQCRPSLNHNMHQVFKKLSDMMIMEFTEMNLMRPVLLNLD